MTSHAHMRVNQASCSVKCIIIQISKKNHHKLVKCRRGGVVPRPRCVFVKAHQPSLVTASQAPKEPPYPPPRKRGLPTAGSSALLSAPSSPCFFVSVLLCLFASSSLCFCVSVLCRLFASSSLCFFVSLPLRLWIRCPRQPSLPGRDLLDLSNMRRWASRRSSCSIFGNVSLNHFAVLAASFP